VLPVSAPGHANLIWEVKIMLRGQSGRAQVLLVDDDSRGSAVRKELLEAQLGLKVWYFEDPAQALLNLDLADWNLLITDFQMPGLNGVQLAQTIRETHPSLPILMITGDLLAAPHPEILDAVLDKAMDPNKFLSAVSLFVSQYQPHETETQRVS
jgi:CheY-like chemotaxis protein